MKTIAIGWLVLCAVFMVDEAAAQSCGGVAASCGGVAASCGGGGVRHGGLFARMHARAAMRAQIRAARYSGCNGVAAGCSGVATGCNGSAVGCSGVAAPVYQAVIVPAAAAVYQNCPGGVCEVVLGTGSGERGTGNGYEIALRSAQYRAANGIHGHTAIESGQTSGVGWSTSNPQPMTCLGVDGENYAVARGRDGWYATKVY